MARDRGNKKENMDSPYDPTVNYELDLDEDYSLEAILAEYKGSAFIAGDRRTPSKVLHEKTERIIVEETGRLPIYSGEIQSARSSHETKTGKPISIRYDAQAEQSDKSMGDTIRMDKITPGHLPGGRNPGGSAVSGKTRNRDNARSSEAEKSNLSEQRRAEERIQSKREEQKVPERGSADKPKRSGNTSTQGLSRQQELAQQQEFTRRQELAHQQETARQQEIIRRQELAKQQELARQQEAARKQQPARPRSMQESAPQSRENGRQQVPPRVPQDFPVAAPRSVDAVRPTEQQDKGIRAAQMIDSDEQFFNEFRIAEKDAPTRYKAEVESAIDRQEELDERIYGDEDEESSSGGLFQRFRESRRLKAQQLAEEERLEREAEEAELAEDAKRAKEREPEPDLLEASKQYTGGLHSLSLRSSISYVIALIILIFTYIIGAGKALPFGIGKDITLATGVLAILFLAIAALGIDILITGVRDLFRAEPGAESLVFASCLFTIIDCLYAIKNPNMGRGLPFCAVSAFSLVFAMRGKKLYRVSMRNTLRAAVAASHPYGVISDYGNIEERAILKKVSADIRGFYTKLTQMDVCENAYSYAAPMLLIGALVLTALATLVKKQPQYFTYSLSSMMAVSASFTALLAYNLPFRIVSSSVKHAGAAIAGWGGACEIYDSDGALITDEDLFPKGTVAFESIKVFEGVSEHKAIAFTASVIAASGSGLGKIFMDLLKSKGISMERVDDFACYEGGGVSGTVRGERVLVGSTGFMNLMGIRVPDSLNTKNAVFCAVNDALIAVFSINYIPANSVQAAIAAILKTRVSMLFAVRDFNVTPAMVKKKFKMTMDGIEYIPVGDCYRISDDKLPDGCDTVAVLSREGLGPFGEAVARGRLLKIIAELATAVTMIGTVFGLLLMFYLSWNASFASASASNVLTYMIVNYFAVSFLARFSARRS